LRRRSPRHQRDRVAKTHFVLREQQVRGEDDGRDQCEHDADPVERDAFPELDHQCEAGKRERQRSPDPPAYPLVAERRRVDRDEERPEVLDQQRDPDLESVDREEVEELHERDAADAEHREAQDLVAPDSERRGRSHERDEHQADAGAGAARLRQTE
jgi:hypothetical protein